MAAFRDDVPPVAGINENWDEDTTRSQIVRPDWDFLPIHMKTMHHLPHIFFDTLRPERPDCPVLVPSSFSLTRDRIISQNIYSYEPCGLPTGDFMPADSAQIRLMTASPVTLRACIPAPDQVTPEEAYFKDLDFYKKTLFHTPFLSRGRAVTLLEYRDAKVIFEVDDWFSTLPAAVKRYLLPLQSKYAKWYVRQVECAPPHAELRFVRLMQAERIESTTPLHAAPHALEVHLVLPNTRLPMLGLVRHLQSRQHARGIEINLGRRVAKQIANQNCFWPVNQTMAGKLLRASKIIIRYVALYSMAGVAMEAKLFRIPPTARDTPFINACAAFLTTKMNLSQVMPSGCNLHCVAHPPDNQRASDYQEEESVVDPADMQMALVTPTFQPYRGATGRAWMAEEYGIAVDTSSLLSSGMEREDTDDEICSFDLGPEPFEPTGQNRLPSDEWLDDHQQGLEPGGSEPKRVDYTRFLAMPHKPSLLDLMHNDMDNSDEVPPPSPECALTPTLGFSYYYAMDAPPDIQRIPDMPRHYTPYPDPPTPSAQPGPVLQPPRPRASSVPPTPKPAKRMALRYQPVTETVTPPISPARAHAVDRHMDPDTPSPIQKSGRSRGRGTWRAPGVGTRSDRQSWNRQRPRWHKPDQTRPYKYRI